MRKLRLCNCTHLLAVESHYYYPILLGNCRRYGLKKIKLFSLTVGFLLGLPFYAFAEGVLIDNFNSAIVGGFPNWGTYPLHKGKAKQVYSVQDEGGNKFLSAVDHQNISTPIFKEFNWDLAKFPYLKFKWRAKELPAGAQEISKSTNDSGCGVYVGFGSKLSGVALKYVWSSGASLGNVWEKDKGKFFIIVKKSGSAGVGQWFDVTVQVAQDYQKYFNRSELRNPFGLGVLTDGNAVQQPAACDYDDFRLSDQP